jgi:molybdenum cofactor guanylyltransferase
LFTAAILAGGHARRLGGIDKSALLVGSHSILDRQLSLLRGLTPHLLIVAGEHATIAAGDTRVVADRIAGAGALGGLYTALIEAPTEQVLVIACDMPFVTAPFLARLVERGEGVDAVVPRDERRRHPLCASYDRRIAGHLKARIDRGELRVGDALAGLDVRELGPDELARFDPDGRLLLNVNTPADYERARS